MNFAKITILSGFVTALRLFCGLLISKVIAIYTGPAGVSNLGQLQSLVTFMNGFIASQVSQGVNRYSAENKYNYEEAKKYWIASTKLSAIACFFIMSLGFVFSKDLSHYLFQNESLFWLIILALSVLPLNIINNIFLGVLNGLGDYKRFFIANVFAIISSLTSMVILVYFLGLNGALVSVALNNAIAGIWLIFLTMKKPWFKLKYWFGSTPKKQLIDMSKYFLMGVIGALTGPISIIVVRTILTNDFSIEFSGYWQAVTKISEAYLAVLTTAMTVYYFPKTVSAKTVSEHLRILSTGVKVVIPLSIIMALTVFLLRDFIIKLLFTKEFILARELFLFQNIGDFFRICSWLFATILLAKGFFLINASLEIIISILFPAFVKLFISIYGFNGVSIAYCATNLVYLLFSITVYCWYIKNEVK